MISYSGTFSIYSGHFKWVLKYILCQEEPQKYDYEVEDDTRSISTVTSIMSQEFINLKYGKINFLYLIYVPETSSWYLSMYQEFFNIKYTSSSLYYLIIGQEFLNCKYEVT